MFVSEVDYHLTQPNPLQLPFDCEIIDYAPAIAAVSRDIHPPKYPSHSLSFL